MFRCYTCLGICKFDLFFKRKHSGASHGDGSRVHASIPLNLFHSETLAIKIKTKIEISVKIKIKIKGRCQHSP